MNREAREELAEWLCDHAMRDTVAIDIADALIANPSLVLDAIGEQAQLRWLTDHGVLERLTDEYEAIAERLALEGFCSCPPVADPPVSHAADCGIARHRAAAKRQTKKMP